MCFAGEVVACQFRPALASQLSEDRKWLAYSVTSFLVNTDQPFTVLIDVGYTTQSAATSVPSISLHRCAAFSAAGQSLSIAVWVA